MKYSVCIFLIFGLLSCNKEEIKRPDSWRGLRLPAHFPVAEKEIIPVTQAGFELGRKLFYDPILSRDNTISCGSCHIQGSAFTHHGHDVSHGIDDRLGKRNAPAVQNLLWQKNYFWDGGVNNLDLIAINPIQNHLEMDETLSNVLEKLNKNGAYKASFKNAFGSDKISTATFLNAISQFMEMLISDHSRYDLYVTGKGTLTSVEIEGLQLFKQKCGSCHLGDLFSDNSFRNNGLKNSFSFDKGRYEISLKDIDIGKFKVPSLRNVALTAPYMHDGSLGNLEGVLNHYALNVKDSPTLDPILKQNGRLGIQLSTSDKIKIIAFLNTMTDTEFVNNPAFAEQ